MYVTRYKPDVVFRPPMVKYIAPSCGLMTTSVSGNGVPERNSSNAPMYVDPSVLERDSVVFRAGRHSLSIAISTHALFRDDPAVVTPLIAASAAAGADAG